MSSPSTVRLFASAHAASDNSCETLSEPLARVMTMLGKRWTGVVLSTLMQGPVFFNDLKRGIAGINDRILNERLVELVGLGLVTRSVIDAGPVRVRYELTEHGYAMRPALDELTRWAAGHLQ